MYLCTRILSRTHIHMHTHTHAYTHSHTGTHTHAHTLTHSHLHTLTHRYTHVHTHTNTHTHAHTQTHTSMRINTHAHMQDHLLPHSIRKQVTRLTRKGPHKHTNVQECPLHRTQAGNKAHLLKHTQTHKRAGSPSAPYLSRRQGSPTPGAYEALPARSLAGSPSGQYASTRSGSPTQGGYAPPMPNGAMPPGPIQQHYNQQVRLHH